MSPEQWHQLSVIFLIAGIVFLLLTIGLALNFRLIAIIRSEFANRKNKKAKSETEYFEQVEKQNSQSENTNPPPVPVQTVNETFASQPQTQPDYNNATVVTSRGAGNYAESATVIKPSENSAKNSSETVVISANNPHRNKVSAAETAVYAAEEESSITDSDTTEREVAKGFVIMETIMKIHGNPENVKHIEY